MVGGKIVKKFLKAFLIVFCIFCIILGIFLLRNYMILNRIHNLQKELATKIENSNNFLYEEKSINHMGEIKRYIYYKDNVYKDITYLNNEIENSNYLNLNEPNGKDRSIYLDTVKNSLARLVDNDTRSFVIKNSICQFIKSTDTQYIVPINKETNDYRDYYYINKNTGMVEKWETKDCVFTYTITENVVTNIDIEKP